MQIITLLFTLLFTVQKYIYPSVCKVHAVSFRVSVIHRTLTRTTESLTCVRWPFLCVRMHTGVGHTDSESTQQFWLAQTHKLFFCSWRGTNSGHWWHRISTESDALTSPNVNDRDVCFEKLKIKQTPEGANSNCIYRQLMCKIVSCYNNKKHWTV